MLTDFIFYHWFGGVIEFMAEKIEIAIESLLNTPSHLKCGATLPCEILRSENSDNLKPINYKIV